MTQRFALSQSQHLVWLGQQLSPQAPLYNMAFTFTIYADLDEAVFREAFGILVETNPALRTIIFTEDGESYQSVLDEIAYVVDWLDFSQEANPDIQFARWLENRKVIMFQLDQCLFDSAVVRLGDAHYVWYFAQHHIMTDASSQALLFKQLGDIYQRILQG